MYLASGPVVASLVTRHGARLVCVTGSLVSSLGLLTASYTSSVTQILVTYSLVTGLGFGMMYIPGVVAAQVRCSPCNTVHYPLWPRLTSPAGGPWPPA